MKSTPFTFVFIIIVVLIFTGSATFAGDSINWKIHDQNRPKPPIIRPAQASSPNKAGKAPSDAVVLFDGADLSQWRNMDGNAAKWIVKNEVMEAVKGSGYIRTLQNFGSCQLHVEWAAPTKVEGNGQGRGNSGVFLMGKYEIQVLDSYDNITYADGQAAAIYGQFPPEVNACRAPGEWQTYDIIFHAPKFCADKKLVKPARVTVFHNGVLVHDNIEIMGPTNWQERTPYSYHREKLPLSLQDHGNPVRYRNIWIREIAEPGEPRPLAKELTLSNKTLESYTGIYQIGQGMKFEIVHDQHGLILKRSETQLLNMYAQNETTFFLKNLDVVIRFHKKDTGEVEGATYTLSGSDMKADKVK